MSPRFKHLKEVAGFFQGPEVVQQAEVCDGVVPNGARAHDGGQSQWIGRIHGAAKGGFSLNFGSYGLKAVEPERITARQIEAARRAITRQMKRQGRVWIRIFPDVPVTDKPAEVRMGKGKGSVEYWAARVHPGRIMFEIDGVSHEIAAGAFERAAAKLPIKVKMVTRLGEQKD